MNKHPSSAGLRQLADFLDNCAEEGIGVEPQVELKLTKENIGPLLKRLHILPPKLPDTTEKWSSIRIDASHKFGGCAVQLWNWRNEICELVTEMRPVEVWRCGGVEVGK